MTDRELFEKFLSQSGLDQQATYGDGQPWVQKKKFKDHYEIRLTEGTAGGGFFAAFEFNLKGELLLVLGPDEVRRPWVPLDPA